MPTGTGTDVDTGKLADSEVHVMAVHYQSDNPHYSPSRRLSAVSKSGFKVVKTVETCPFYVRDTSEPFGFQDGISQPYVPGLSSERVKSSAATDARPDDDNTVAPANLFWDMLTPMANALTRPISRDGAISLSAMNALPSTGVM